MNRESFVTFSLKISTDPCKPHLLKTIMTTFARISALIISILMFYILIFGEYPKDSANIEVILGSIVIALCSLLLLIYSLIGHRLKGEGNIFTENYIDAMKRDIKLILKIK